jgi:hypothetical protein
MSKFSPNFNTNFGSVLLSNRKAIYQTIESAISVTNIQADFSTYVCSIRWTVFSSVDAAIKKSVFFTIQKSKF